MVQPFDKGAILGIVAKCINDALIIIHEIAVSVIQPPDTDRPILHPPQAVLLHCVVPSARKPAAAAVIEAGTTRRRSTRRNGIPQSGKIYNRQRSATARNSQKPLQVGSTRRLKMIERKLSSLWIATPRQEGHQRQWHPRPAARKLAAPAEFG